jgi:FixJ family two-component response regulator
VTQPRKRLAIIADDHPAMRALVRSVLRGTADEIIEAGDGRALFWELLRCSYARDAVDVVVITDLCMPVYSGLDVVATFDELGFHPNTIVITSYPDPKVSSAVERAGAVLVPKPFTTSAFRSVVERAWK